MTGTMANMSPRRFSKLAAALLLLLPFSVGRCLGAAGFAPSGTLTRQPDGSVLVTARDYRALIGADGNLHSFRVGDDELIDDRVSISLGAFFFSADAPVKLTSVTITQAATIDATDGTRAIRYSCGGDGIEITLANTARTDLSYFVVLSPDVTIVRNVQTKEAAASPVSEERWPDVECSLRDGTFLALTGGTRVWGPWAGRQVWEVSEVRPGRPRSISLHGGVKPPPKPTLEQLIGVRAEASDPDGPAASLRRLEFTVWVENRSETEHAGEVSMDLSNYRGELSLSMPQAIQLPPKKVSVVKFPLRVETPGFYTGDFTVSADGRDVARTTAVAGYRLRDIVATPTQSAEFRTFWQKVVTEADQGPLEMQYDPNPPRTEQGVTFAAVHYPGFGGKTIHGWYLFPSGARKLPAILYLSGYGARRTDPPLFLAQQGYTVLAIDVRGNAVDRPRVPDFEDYCTLGLESADTYVYREIVGHALRALRLLATLGTVDPDRLAVVGVSEGGGVGLILATLDTHLRAVAADAPMLCNLPLSLRYAGWPYTKMNEYLKSHPDEATQIAHTLSYFDVVNFAPDVKTPALLSVGFLDRVSLPTAVYGVYNLLAGPKEMRPYPNAGHEGGGEELWTYKLRWLARQLAARP